MKAPTVSVIVPNYNHAPFLKERINSVLNQTWQDFELILLDDCSPDNSRDIINCYRDNPHVSHIVLNEKNTGNTFIQWERGISLAQGNYIWIAESDDVAEPELLATLMGELERHPKAVIAYSHSQMIDADGKPMPLTWHKHGSSGETRIFQGDDFLRRKMLVNNDIYNASMAVFRKSVFPLIPKNYQQYRYCGDWLFWNYVCMNGEVIEVCRVLNRYRQHEKKVTMSSQQDGRKWRDQAGLLCEFSDLLKLNGLQRRCLRGRWTKRYLKEGGRKNLPELQKEFPYLYGGTQLDILLYEIGKLFGFLKGI